MTAFKHFFAEPEIADCFSVYKKQEVNDTSCFLMIVSDIALNTIVISISNGYIERIILNYFVL